MLEARGIDIAHGAFEVLHKVDLTIAEGRIVEASWYGDTAVSLPLGEHFHARRLRLISSQVGAVSPAMRGRRSYGERLGFALSLLADPRLDALLGSVTRFDDLPSRMPSLLGGGLCHVVTYGEN